MKRCKRRVRAKRLGFIFKNARELQGFTQVDVAAWLNWSRAKVSRIEQGVSLRLCAFDARALCRILGLDLERTITGAAVADTTTQEARKLDASRLAGIREE